MIAKAAETSGDGRSSNLLIEITEYSPITDQTLALIKEMKDQGVVFAIDGENGNPGKGMDKTGTHSCSFVITKAKAKLFAAQKLALPMSCPILSFSKSCFVCIYAFVALN